MCQPDQGPEIHLRVAHAEEFAGRRLVCAAATYMTASVDGNPYLLCCRRTTYALGSGTTRSRGLTAPSHEPRLVGRMKCRSLHHSSPHNNTDLLASADSYSRPPRAI